MPRHMSRYRVQLYDVNAFGELHAATVLRFMQQTASDASAAAGFDVEWYAEHGTIWLIRRSTVEYVTPAIYRDQLAVQTWVSDIRRVRSRREYELRRIGDDTLIARGVSDWVYVDTATGKPVRAPEELQRGLMPTGMVAQERRAQKPALPPPNAFRTARRVEFAAIDSVVHVNNAQYAVYLEQDLWDALAAHGWTFNPASPIAGEGPLRVRTYDIEYFDAALYGDQLTGLMWVTDIAADGFRCEHTLQRDGRRLLHAVSEWRWAAGALPPALQRAAHALAIV